MSSASFVQPARCASALPPAFCWTKFGVEAGEPVVGILARKERERAENGGTFLWGIGTSVRPSLEALLPEVPEPDVLFSPMRSRPAPRDVEPDGVVAWRSATGLDGRAFEIPQASLVTSRTSARKTHFALVCHSGRPLPVSGKPEGGDAPWVDDLTLRNLLTGRPVGSSQVTSVVRPVSAAGSRRYRVAFRAQLRAPYLLVLSDPEPA